VIQLVSLTFGHNWGRTNRTVVLLMGKMHWSIWHLVCVTEASSQGAGLHQSTAAEQWEYNARTEILIYF